MASIYQNNLQGFCHIKLSEHSGTVHIAVIWTSIEILVHFGCNQLCPCVPPWVTSDMKNNPVKSIFHSVLLTLRTGLSLHWLSQIINTLRLRQNGGHFPDDSFKCIFLNEKTWILNLISLNLVLSVQLTICQHWLRSWLGADQATSYNLNQWWNSFWCIYASPHLNELNIKLQPFHCQHKGMALPCKALAIDILTVLDNQLIMIHLMQHEILHPNSNQICILANVNVLYLKCEYMSWIKHTYWIHSQMLKSWFVIMNFQELFK